MIEQTNNAVYFYAFYTSNKTGKTGLTVTIDVYRNRVEVVTGGSATEMGDGVYYYQLASGTVNAEGEYVAIFKTSDSTVDVQHVPALWVVGKAGVENLDAAVSTRSSHSAADVAAAVWAYTKATVAALADTTIGRYIYDKLGLISSGSGVTVVSPVAGDQTITVVRGDDYKNTDNRALSFTLSNAPSLTSGSVKLIVETGHTPPFEKAGTVTSSTECYIELTTTETVTFPVGNLRYDLQTTLSNGNVVTPVQGTFRVLADVR